MKKHWNHLMAAGLIAALTVTFLSACAAQTHSDGETPVGTVTMNSQEDLAGSGGETAGSTAGEPRGEAEGARERTGRFLKAVGADGLIVIDQYGPVTFTLEGEDQAVLDMLNDGDRISVRISPIMETWPGQATVYGCELLERGSRSDIDGDTLAQLIEMHQIEPEPLTPMLYVYDTLFFSSGRPAAPGCGTEDGSFTSVIDSALVPSENGQANFGSTEDGYILMDDGAVAVRSGDACILFLDGDTVEFEGRFFKKSELDDKTLKWLENYNSMPPEDRRRLSYVPPALIDASGGDMPAEAVRETDSDD